MCVSCKCVSFPSIFLLSSLLKPFKTWYMYSTDINYVFFCLVKELNGTGKKVLGGGGGGGWAEAERGGS